MEAKRLDLLFGAMSAADVKNMKEIEITGITSDSRTVEPGSLFVAVRGTTVDGHRFVDNAIARGAVAVVSEEPIDDKSVPNAVVADSARALAELASGFYGDPSRQLRLIGVTGTNGKTSTTHLLRSICDASSWGNVGVIGTIGHGTGHALEAAVHTTPEPLTLHRLFADMASQECIGVVMEVSSHAVRQQRVWGIEFEIGMLTNITRDHLDYHPTFEDYVAAKTEFVYSLVEEGRKKPAGTLIYSLDNDEARRIGGSFPGAEVSTSIEGEADVWADGIRATLGGTTFTLRIGDQSTEVKLRLLGLFSAANAVMAAAGAHLLGIDIAAIKRGLESVHGVPGRFEAFGGDGRPAVVVDYSHTPDSLERTLQFCAKLEPSNLVAVFGCGGDRDKGKRPVMGAIAQENADICYVTSDNPRTEDPDAIIEDILEGMDRTAEGIHVDVDRRAAIAAAIANAGPDDLVAICGKGHEDYQIIGTTKHHFDDREEAQAALEKWGDR